MKKIDLHEELKQDSRVWMPGAVDKDIQHFNVFYVRHHNDGKFSCKPFSRKGLYKISLLTGRTRLYYADETIEFDCALLFTNPNIPYAWDHLEPEQTAYFCVFTEEFFEQFVPIKDYPVFKLGHTPLFHLNPAQFAELEAVFKQMLEEVTLEFSYKDDSLRTMVLRLIFSALKLQPATFQKYRDSNSSQRITALFTELLERQFPIASARQRLELRHPTDFANQLAVHVNHLNYALKAVVGKTTSQLITERLMQEARSLLHHTNLNISEIAGMLGFDDLSHFINFFKKNQLQTPKNYRQSRYALGA